MRNPIWTKFNTSSNGLLATRQGNERTWVNITMKSGVTADLIFNCKLCCAACAIEVKCISWHLLHLEKRICIYTVSHSMWNLPFISNKNFLKKGSYILPINISSRSENILFPWIFATLNWLWVLESAALMVNLWRIPPLQNWIEISSAMPP